MLRWGCAVAALMVGAAPMAQAQDQATPAVPPAPASPQADSVASAPAQSGPAQSPAQEEPDATGDEIVVTGELRGAVPGDIKPEVQLNPADIRAFGASDVSELLGQLAAQLGSGSGRGDEQPVVLLSGRRATMAEVRGLPTEAIERIDILPEEVALRYGYSATQKVINFVLRNRFMALTNQLEGRMPTASGNAGVKADAKLDKIRRNDRLSLDVTYDQSSGILESERGVSRAGSSLFDTRGNIAGIAHIDPITGLISNEIDPALSAAAGRMVTEAGVPAAAAGGAQGLGAFVGTANQPNVTDVTPYRTLVNPQKNLQVNAVYQRPLSDKIKASATMELSGSESQSLLGLPGVTLRLPTGNPFSPFARDTQALRYVGDQSPLTRSNSARGANLGLNLNGDGTPWAANWNWSFQGSYNLNTTQSFTDGGVDPVAMQALLTANDATFNPFAAIPASLIRSRPFDTANSRSGIGKIDLMTNGALFKLPAGDANVTVRVSGTTSDFSSDSFRRGIVSRADISRDSAAVRGNINLPIASRRLAVLDAIGDLSVNANFEVEQFSDFGRLVTTGYGFNWSPIAPIRAVVSWTQDSNPPTAQALGNPLVTTPNVRVFDYVRGESVDITAITGGNPALRADSRHVFKAGLNIRPFTETNLTLSADYTSQRTRNSDENFPGATAEIEAAFPDRFVRDADGQLLSIDYRPVNFARAEQSQLKWGFNLFLPISSPAQKRMQERRTAFQAAMAESRRTGQPLPPEMTAQLEQFRRLGQQQSLFGGNQRRQGQGQGQGQSQQGQGQPQPQGQGADQAPPQGQGATPGDGQNQGPRRFGPGGSGGGGRGFGGGGGRGGFGGNLIQFSAYHTWVFKDERLIRAGLPVMDYLNGAAKGSNGGTPAHKIEIQSGIQRDGLRFRLEGSWQSGSEVTTGVLGSSDRLNFGSLAKVGLTAQVDLNQQLNLLLRHPWLRGTRISFRVDNLFDARQRVTDENGDTPPAYEPNLLDPTGRVVRLSIRKQFF